MREAIIDTVSQTGGHLGASLGTVELTIALHRELESPRDRIIWDVGHQAYGHKLLTGRLEGFPTLRQHGGISGFLRRVESEHDIMGAGHASTSISYATGLAEAGRHGRQDGHVVCVIGDGALTGGMAYEGLNQAGAPEVADHGRAERQRDEHLGERGRALQALPARARQPDAHQGARGDRARPGQAAGRRRDGRAHPRRHQVAVVRGRGALRGARLRLLRPHRRPRHRRGPQGPAHDARDGPPGRDPRQDDQGQGLRAGRGRRGGHARRHPVLGRERQGGEEVVRRPAELHRGLRPRAGRRGRARPARRRHHRRDAQGHGDAAHDEPLPRAHLRRRHRRAARGRVRLRARDRRLPAGLRDLLDLPAAGLRPDHPRRGDPEPAGRLRDRPGRPGGRRRPDAPRRLRPRLPALDPRPDGDGADGRGGAGATCSTPPSGWTARWPSAIRAAPAWAWSCPSARVRSRSAGGT